LHHRGVIAAFMFARGWMVLHYDRNGIVRPPERSRGWPRSRHEAEGSLSNVVPRAGTWPAKGWQNQADNRHHQGGNKTQMPARVAVQEKLRPPESPWATGIIRSVSTWPEAMIAAKKSVIGAVRKSRMSSILGSIFWALQPGEVRLWNRPSMVSMIIGPRVGGCFVTVTNTGGPAVRCTSVGVCGFGFSWRGRPACSSTSCGKPSLKTGPWRVLPVGNNEIGIRRGPRRGRCRWLCLFTSD